ncbi:putative transcription factor B3-Domain family [Arabidopsis thaliana]
MVDTELYSDRPFNADSSFNILITLTPSDVGLSNMITFSKEIVETKMLPLLPKNRFIGYLDFFDFETKIVTTLTVQEDANGDFQFHGWSMVLQRNNYKIDDIIRFWWDANNSRFNFQVLMIA